MPPPAPGGPRPGGGFIAKLRTTLEMIKFEHSIFALPFALTGAMLAVRGWPTWRQVLWLIVAMVGARSAAMTFNRIADLKLDELNPRTRMRALPSGQISLRFALGFTLLSCALLVLAAHELNPLAFKLSPLALAVLIAYSYTKRFTVLSHVVLGACLGMSPVAAWIALRGEVSLSVLLLGGAVTLWTAGFDIIYACQDVDFDHALGLHSVPKALRDHGGSLCIRNPSRADACPAGHGSPDGESGMDRAGGLTVRGCSCWPTNTPSSNPLTCPA